MSGRGAEVTARAARAHRCDRSVTAGSGGRRHTFADLYHERTNYQFIDRSWRWALLSGTAVVVSLLFLVLGGLNLGIDFEGGTQWSFTRDGGSASTPRRPRRPGRRGPGRREGRSSSAAPACGCRPRSCAAKERDAITAALAEYGEHRRRPGERHQRGPDLGRPGLEEGAPGARRLLRRDRDLPEPPLRVAHGVRRDRRGGPRHHHHRRRVRDHRVRGHARDGRRVPDDPRVLAVRHRRRVRQGEGERGDAGRGPGRDLLADGQPVVEPGAHALAQHRRSSRCSRWCRCSWSAATASAPWACRTSRSRCSSVCSPVRTRRSSSPRRSSPRSRSASRSTGRSASGLPSSGSGVSCRRPESARTAAVAPAPETTAVATLERAQDGPGAGDRDGTTAPAEPVTGPRPTPPPTGGVTPRPRRQRRKRK